MFNTDGLQTTKSLLYVSIITNSDIDAVVTKSVLLLFTYTNKKYANFFLTKLDNYARFYYAISNIDMTFLIGQPTFEYVYDITIIYNVFILLFFCLYVVIY